jgi:hypothetical protein
MMDVQSCLVQGAVGAAGAIPGTTLAHPFDVLKIRMQTGHAPSLRAAITGLVRESGARGLYRGLAAGVQQKVLTRGPMFLASEAATQLCEAQLGLGRTPAVFVGSVFSGYTTGSMAAVFEWRKVLGATSIGAGAAAAAGSGGGGGGSVGLISEARQAGQLRSVLRRLHGAGVRNAIFDGTFFGMSHILRQQLYLPELSDRLGWCYALAASAAVVVDYAVDVAVKRNMSAGPRLGVSSVGRATFALVARKGVAAVYVGLSAKTLEFATSYFVTGLTSVYLVHAFKQI